MSPRHLRLRRGGTLRANRHNVSTLFYVSSVKAFAFLLILFFLLGVPEIWCKRMKQLCVERQRATAISKNFVTVDFRIAQPTQCTMKPKVSQENIFFSPKSSDLTRSVSLPLSSLSYSLRVLFLFLSPLSLIPFLSHSLSLSSLFKIFHAFVVCRDSRGTGCDAPELCTGTSKACPPDEPAPRGTRCRDRFTKASATSAAAQARLSAECSFEEVCDGVRFTCPPGTPKERKKKNNVFRF